jgi:hypothetical protein
MKILAWGLGSIAIVVLLSVGVYSFLNLHGLKPKVSVAEEKTKDGGTIIKINETKKSDVDEEFPFDMGESEMQESIHYMSHQKVIADKKWGMIPLTKDRVKRLINVVQKNENKYEDSDVYLDILNRWNNSDFSQIDEDHNDIWHLQNGTVGIARGILSVDEEKEFIKENFDIEE